MDPLHAAAYAPDAGRFKRKTFYLPGFDPRGARFYHQSYRAEAANYTRLSGETVTVSERRKGGGTLVDWAVVNEVAGVDTDYSFLAWDDIIRRSWINNPATLLPRSLRTYWNYARQIDWPRVAKLPRGPLVTLFYPALSTLLVPTGLFLAVSGIAAFWLGAWALLLGLAVALVVGYVILHRMKSFWLLRFFIFNDELTRGAADPEIETRLDSFADRIAAELREGRHHEVQLVTHSNGSILSMPLMARLLDRMGGEMPANFTLVTLGQCIPLLGCRLDAGSFHRALERVARGRFRWLDIGYMPDGAAFSKVDPFGIHAGQRQVELEQINPRFFRFWSKAAYEKRRKNKYELHFDYLRCGEELSPIDHLSMTAGRRPIAAALAAFKAVK